MYLFPRVYLNKKNKVKKLEYKKYVDAKASRTALLEKEEQHKRAIALLCENHTCDIEAVFCGGG